MTSASADPASIPGIWSLLSSIDWNEPWLIGLLGFHLFCGFATLATILLDRPNIQTGLFLSFLGLVYCSEYINEWASVNYRKFANQQYFDSQGMFISLLFSTPLMLQTFCIVIFWMWTAIQTMVKLKRAKIRSEIKSQEEKDK